MNTQSVSGPITMTVDETNGIDQYRRVKFKSGTTSNPPECALAGAGEACIGISLTAADDGNDITIQPLAKNGTFTVVAADSFSVGASLYGAASGKVSDSSSGTAQFIAIEAATADNDEIEAMLYPAVSTTAATVSIADSGAFTSAATVEAALQEIYQHIASAQAFIPIPLTTWFEGDASNTVAALGPSTTPTLDMANGDTDSGLLITWASSNNDPIITQIPLPPDLDTGSDLVLHFRGKMGGSTDTPTIAGDAYFNEGDTKVEDASSAFGDSYAEDTITIAAADIPSGAQTVTIELTPGAHTTDTMIVSATWLEYQRSILTS